MNADCYASSQYGSYSGFRFLRWRLPPSWSSENAIFHFSLCLFIPNVTLKVLSSIGLLVQKLKQSVHFVALAKKSHL
jgi:hypothetical protein